MLHSASAGGSVRVSFGAYESIFTRAIRSCHRQHTKSPTTTATVTTGLKSISGRIAWMVGKMKVRERGEHVKRSMFSLSCLRRWCRERECGACVMPEPGGESLVHICVSSRTVASSSSPSHERYLLSPTERGTQQPHPDGCRAAYGRATGATPPRRKGRAPTGLTRRPSTPPGIRGSFSAIGHTVTVTVTV